MYFLASGSRLSSVVNRTSRGRKLSIRKAKVQFLPSVLPLLYKPLICEIIFQFSIYKKPILGLPLFIINLLIIKSSLRRLIIILLLRGYWMALALDLKSYLGCLHLMSAGNTLLTRAWSLVHWLARLGSSFEMVFGASVYNPLPRNLF